MASLFDIPLTLGDPTLPPAGSLNADTHDGLYAFITWGVTGFFFVAIITVMVFFAWKYRRQNPEQAPRSRASHSTALEIAWSLPPLIIVLIIFGVGLADYVKTNTPYADAMKIDVVGKQWAWDFTHPYKGSPTTNAMHVIKDVPVEVVITSTDVIHSLGIPAFRLTKDAVPERYNYAWFVPTRPGIYPIFCREYCGDDHASMLSYVVVHETRGEWEAAMEDILRKVHEELPDELYEQWRAAETEAEYEAVLEQVRQLEPTEVIADWDAVVEEGELKPAWLVGKEIWQSQGCVSCHVIDGPQGGNAPSWVGAWGTERVMSDGQRVVVDEEYIRESIYQPLAKIVSGYGGNMPAAPQLSERDVAAIIALFRQLEDGPLEE
jgi:cytochrome c oxidase subunit 2